MTRTFPDHEFFNEEDGYGQKALFNVLKALSLTHKEMGYCQSLNFICAVFTLYCNDEVFEVLEFKPGIGCVLDDAQFDGSL